MANELSKQQKLDLRYLRMARIWAENSYCKIGRASCRERV